MIKTLHLSILLVAGWLFFQPRIAMAVRCDANEPALARWELISALRRDGFSNMLDEYTELTRIGNIKVSEKTCFTFFFYAREFMAASNLHYSTRLLVFKNWNYLGMYGTDGDPKIQVNGNAVVVFGDRSTEKIVFDKADPPKKIYIQGAWRSLFK